MSFTASQLLAVTNWLICMAVAWACICRLNSDICKRRLLLRARYTLLLTGALASGLQPALWGEWPGIGDILFALTVLGSLLLNIQRWGANGWTDDAHIYREG